MAKICLSLGVSIQRPAGWETFMLIARALRRYPILPIALLLALYVVAEPAYAQLQGIGLAGAYAVNYGQQSQTSQITPDTVSGIDSVTLGVGTTSTGNSSVVLGNLSSDDGQSGVVSVGNASTGLTRRITDLAPGINASDAVTVGQLDGATSGLLSQAYSYTDSQISGILSSA
jgi:trimeric autotransporter adhesin